MIKGNYVPGEGSPEAKIAFIGEAPGQSEEAQGRPFTGASGNLLNEILSNLNISRNDIYITNVLKYRPPGNRFYAYKSIGLNLFDCVQELKHEINQLDPNVCVVFGANALNALTGHKKITNWRGSIIPWNGRNIVPTIHPAHILHNRGETEKAEYWMKGLIKHDIARAMSIANDKFYIPKKKLHLVCKSSEQLYEFLNRHKDAEYMASDIEITLGSSGIPICTSLCFDETESMSIPLFSEIPVVDVKLAKPSKVKYTKNNYSFEYKILDRITTGMPKHHLPEVWRLIAKAYDNPQFKQLGQNFKYDEDKLNRFGFYLQNYHLDISLAGHTLYPEFPRNLAFWTSIYTEEPFYKDEGKDFNPTRDDISQYFIYNAKDSSVTYEVGLAMITYLKKKGLWNYYTKVVHPLHYLYSHVDKQGLDVDEDIRDSLFKKYAQMQGEGEIELNKLIGKPINVNSPKQVKELVYGNLGIKPFTFRGSADYGTGVDVIASLLAKRVRDPIHREILERILKQRKINKTLSPNYLGANTDYDGKLKTTHFIVGTETSRTSTALQKPPIRPEKLGWAFQTITKHGEIGSDIRLMCIPEKGKLFIQIDSAQAEARVVALLSNDENALQLMNEIDFHAWTASFIFGETWQNHSKAMNNGIETPQRFIGKASRHAFNLMIKPPRMATNVQSKARAAGINIGIFSEADAAKTIEAIHTSTPKVREIFHKGVKEALAVGRTLVAPQGGRRTFYARWDDELLKEACAYIPQYTVTTNTKLAMLELRKRIPEVKIHIEAHDSFLISVKKEIVEEVKEISKGLMERPISFEHCTFKRRDLIIPAEAEVGENYKEMR